VEAQINWVYAAQSFPVAVRYQAFVKAFPSFYQRIPLHLIASYLGISRKILRHVRKPLVVTTAVANSLKEL
jgi:hypothetical protein